MKRMLLLVFTALSLVACQDDDDLQGAGNVLNLDGPNVTGPILEAGTHRFAVQFYEEDLDPFAGQSLGGLRIFVGQAPASMRLSVYRGGEASPSREVTALNVTSFGQVRRFIDYRLPDLVPIDPGTFLWVEAEVELLEAQQSIGCDDGPAIEGGDWLWSGDRYIPYIERTGESVNWNIRGLVE